MVEGSNSYLKLQHWIVTFEVFGTAYWGKPKEDINMGMGGFISSHVVSYSKAPLSLWWKDICELDVGDHDC